MGNFFSGSSSDPDGLWKQQNREQKENLLYRYVNLQKGGELVRIYETYGQKELEDFIRKEIQPLLYNEGKGKIIEKADFVRWKRKCEARLKVGIFHGPISLVIYTHTCKLTTQSKNNVLCQAYFHTDL